MISDLAHHLNIFYQKTFQNFLPAIIQVVQQALEAGDEASARQLFDVFETLLILVSHIHVEPINY
jgi:hypothetical protein